MSHLEDIANRLMTLCREAAEDGDPLDGQALVQCLAFFIAHPEVPLPKLTAAPGGTLRARWIEEAGNFTAIEFTQTAMEVVKRRDGTRTREELATPHDLRMQLSSHICDADIADIEEKMHELEVIATWASLRHNHAVEGYCRMAIAILRDQVTQRRSNLTQKGTPQP